LDRRILRYFAVGLDYAHLESFDFKRDQEISGVKLVPGTFSWNTTALALYLRAGYPIVPELYPFVQLSAGAAWASTRLLLEGASQSSESALGPLASVGVGVHLASPYMGVAICTGYSFASVLDNRIGDEHSSSGAFFLVSLRVQTLEGDF
jgi:hypothetical protein